MKSNPTIRVQENVTLNEDRPNSTTADAIKEGRKMMTDSSFH